MKVLGRVTAIHRGDALPLAVETVDGERAVMKLRGAGALALIAELIVNRTGARLGLPVPEVFFVEIPGDLPWSSGRAELDDLLRRSPGLHLGTAPLEAPRRLSPDEITTQPVALLRAMATLDAFFVNADRTGVVVDAAGTTWLVDHGGCRFVDPAASADPIGLPASHLLAGREAELLDPALLDRLADLDLLGDALDAVPESWLLEAGRLRAELHARLVARGHAARDHLSVGG